MKFSGRALSLDSTTVPITRTDGTELALTVTALPIGTDDRLRAMLTKPVPRLSGFARDEHGKHIRDEDGRLVPAYNLQDPAYQDQLAKYNRLYSVLMIREGLRDDPTIAWETEAPPPGGSASVPTAIRKGPTSARSADEYAEKLYAEFCASGLSMGELNRLLDAVLRISALGEKELGAARADFLPRPPTAQDGPSAPTPAAPNSISDTASGKGSASPRTGSSS